MKSMIANKTHQLDELPIQDQTIYQSPELPADVLEDLATVGASFILDGSNTEAKLTEALVKEFGEDARLYGGEIFERSKAKLDKIRKIAKINKTPSELRAEIDPAKPLSGKMIFNMVRGYLEEGVPEEKVLGKVHEDHQEIWPKVTFDEVSEAFTGYGKVKYPQLADTVEAELRESPKYVELLAKLEAVRLEMNKAVLDWNQYLTEIRPDGTDAPANTEQ